MNIEVQDKLSPGFARVASEASDAERIKISEGMGVEVRSLIVRHLAKEAGERHTTAERLGASPTGFLAQLAENFDQSSTVEVDDDGVSITMRHPALSRALHDVQIVPVNAQYLTIPANALAYGRRVGEFDQVQFVHRNQEIRTDLPAFFLVRSVTQKQDPTLLPSLDEINTAAALGAKRAIKAILAGG